MAVKSGDGRAVWWGQCRRAMPLLLADASAVRWGRCYQAIHCGKVTAVLWAGAGADRKDHCCRVMPVPPGDASAKKEVVAVECVFR